MNSRCASSKKNASFGFGRSPTSGRLSYSWASIHSTNVEYSRGRSMTSATSSRVTIPLPVRGRPEQVVHVELGLAEEDVGALLLDGHDRAQDHAQRRRADPAQVLEDRLAVVGAEELERRPQVGEIQQRQVLVVAVAEDQRQDRGLGVVEVQDLAQQERPERGDARADVGADLAGQRQDLERVAGRLERHLERLAPADDVGVGRVAGGADAREVALHVDREHRHAQRPTAVRRGAGGSWSCRCRWRPR